MHDEKSHTTQSHLSARQGDEKNICKIFLSTQNATLQSGCMFWGNPVQYIFSKCGSSNLAAKNFPVRNYLQSFIHFTPPFLFKRVADTAALGRLEISHGFFQTLIVPMAQRKCRTKPGRRCNHATSWWNTCSMLYIIFTSSWSFPIFRLIHLNEGHRPYFRSVCHKTVLYSMSVTMSSMSRLTAVLESATISIS